MAGKVEKAGSDQWDKPALYWMCLSGMRHYILNWFMKQRPPLIYPKQSPARCNILVGCSQGSGADLNLRPSIEYEGYEGA